MKNTLKLIIVASGLSFSTSAFSKTQSCSEGKELYCIPVTQECNNINCEAFPPEPTCFCAEKPIETDDDSFLLQNENLRKIESR